MGNCIVFQEKPVRVMKTDGKILEYKSPVKVHQVLSEYSHHAISDRLPVVNHMHPSTEMLRGHLYYLLPLPVPVGTPQPAKKKKKPMKKVVRFSDEVVELEEARQATEVVRIIKLVISKQELQAMIGKEGASVEDLVSQVQKEPTMYKIESIDRDHKLSSKQWQLTNLEAIQEVE